jgi:DNA-binding transcriptional LysR family regulator
MAWAIRRGSTLLVLLTAKLPPVLPGGGCAVHPPSPTSEKFAQSGESRSCFAMPRHLPLTALRAFEAATRTGSFRSAADDLGLTPSAVSHAIRGLERDLGTVLFEREGRTIRLTPEGETLMRHVERGFGELQLGIGSVAARGPQLLKLHCAPSFAAQWLVPRLRRLLEECSGLELRIAAGTDYTRFLADEFDVDIVYGVPPADFYGPPTHQGVVVLPLGTEAVAPLCAPSLAPSIRSARPVRPNADRERQQEGPLAGLVRRQRPGRARPARPPLRPQLPVAERGGGRPGRRARIHPAGGARDRLRPLGAPPARRVRGRGLHRPLAGLPSRETVRAVASDVLRMVGEGVRPRHQPGRARRRQRARVGLAGGAAQVNGPRG